MSIIAGLFGAGGTILQGLFNQNSAQASMDFQREVLQNRNQWAVADLKKAGLNPILAAGATSSGSASGATAHMDNPGEKAVSSAMQAKMADLAKEQLILNQQKTQAEINLTSAETAKKWAEVNYYGPQAESLIGLQGSSAQVNYQNIEESEARVSQIYAQALKIDQEVENLVEQRRLILEEIKTARSQTLKNTLDARLASAQTALTQKLETARQLGNEGLTIANELARLDLPKEQAKNEYYRSGLGRFITKVGEAVKSLSPLIPSSVPSGLSLPGKQKIGF